MFDSLSRLQFGFSAAWKKVIRHYKARICYHDENNSNFTGVTDEDAESVKANKQR